MFKRSRRVALLASLMACTAAAADAREMVAFEAGVRPGTAVVRNGERRLYLLLGNGAALRYPVPVGRPGKQWFGQRALVGKHVRPAWSPPAEVKRDNPRLPNVIAGGSPSNPMGAAAMTLAGGEDAIPR